MNIAVLWFFFSWWVSLQVISFRHISFPSCLHLVLLTWWCSNTLVNILILLFYICPPEVQCGTPIRTILQFFHEHRIQVLIFYIVFIFYIVSWFVWVIRHLEYSSSNLVTMLPCDVMLRRTSQLPIGKSGNNNNKNNKNNLIYAKNSLMRVSEKK